MHSVFILYTDTLTVQINKKKKKRLNITHSLLHLLCHTVLYRNKYKKQYLWSYASEIYIIKQKSMSPGRTTVEKYMNEQNKYKRKKKSIKIITAGVLNATGSSNLLFWVVMMIIIIKMTIITDCCGFSHVLKRTRKRRWCPPTQPVAPSFSASYTPTFTRLLWHNLLQRRNAWKVQWWLCLT